MTGESAIDVAKFTLMEFALVLAVGSACGALARELKLPDIVIYLIAGMALGPVGVGLFQVPADSALNQAVLIFGACYLLFDGGASLHLKVLSRVWISILIISTVGVLITGGVTAAAAYAFIPFPQGLDPLVVALLIGAAIASTDPATLVPIFKQVPIRARVAQTVMSESAFNDAMGAIVTFAVLGLATHGMDSFSPLHSLGDLLYEAGIGVVIGLVYGFALIYLISPHKLGLFSGYSSVIKIVAILGSYLVADFLHASGFMAVFVVGIIVGNKDMFGATFRHVDQHEYESFVGVFSTMMRMFIFLLLGSQVDFGLMSAYLIPGVIVVTLFMLVARPLTVFICCLPDRRAKWELRELLFMCWTRETGVIPAALAGMLVGMNAPGAKIVAAITFIAILMTIIIQASTTPWLAEKLGLLESSPQH